MTCAYIGAKVVAAWPEEREGKPGYAVKYSDEYISWSPKAVFEDAYRPVRPGEKSLIDQYGASNA